MPFSRACVKVNIIVQMEFKFEAKVQHFSHYAIKTPILKFNCLQRIIINNYLEPWNCLKKKTDFDIK